MRFEQLFRFLKSERMTERQLAASTQLPFSVMIALDSPLVRWSVWVALDSSSTTFVITHGVEGVCFIPRLVNFLPPMAVRHLTNKPKKQKQLSSLSRSMKSLPCKHEDLNWNSTAHGKSWVWCHEPQKPSTGNSTTGSPPSSIRQY